MIETLSLGVRRGRELRSLVAGLIERLESRWDEASQATRTKIQVGALVAATVVAYSYSLDTLLSEAGLDTPLAYISLVPAISLALAALKAKPQRVEPAIYDRQTDYIVGIPMMVGAMAVNLFMPSQLSSLYWLWRIDLLTLPLFVAGAVSILFGIRTLWRQKIAIAYLLLAWPYPYSVVLSGFLDTFTNFTVSALDATLKVIPVASPISSQGSSLFSVSHAGRTFPVSVVSACSGINSTVGFLLVGSAFGAVVRGNRLSKFAWLVFGMFLLWVFNLARILFVFWSGGMWGEHIAMDDIHPYLGVVTFSTGVILMMFLVRPFGLEMFGSLPARQVRRVAVGPMPRDLGTKQTVLGQYEFLDTTYVSGGLQNSESTVQETIMSIGGESGKSNENNRGPAAVPKIIIALAVVIIASLVVGVSDYGLRTFNLVADASGEPKLLGFTAAQVAPKGWQPHFTAEYDWAKSLFGSTSTWRRYVFSDTKGTGTINAPIAVTADVIDAPTLSGFSAYGIEACYQFHGYTLKDVSQVSLGGGVEGQSMSFATTTGSDWSIVYWIIPVRLNGSTQYERVVLYVQNTKAERNLLFAGKVSSVHNLSGMLERSDPVDAQLIANRDFLVEFAKQMISQQASLGTKVRAISPLTSGE